MDILGTEYELIEDENLEGMDGCCQPYSRRIYLLPIEAMLDGSGMEAKKIRHAEVLRHEIVHAMLHESGMVLYSEDEQLVDWIAIMFPRMEKLFTENKCLRREWKMTNEEAQIALAGLAMHCELTDAELEALVMAAEALEEK